MKVRDPELFEFYIGRHIPPSERLKPFSADVSLVERIFRNIDDCSYNNQLKDKISANSPTSSRRSKNSTPTTKPRTTPRHRCQRTLTRRPSPASSSLSTKRRPRKSASRCAPN
ncbi:hypothetical protein DFJ73DRAFT_329646 [Zopfochytrium polystomum]|nr:hypothetical protein DFJ73DRAFT_329646 [Zopfochytrium polystomum]